MSPAAWWQRAVIYHVYPRSFMDADGDGVGDLEGVRRRLDHLAWLGVDALWLSPVYPSPMADFGYDVADYTGIDPLFGSMDDFDRLLDEVHRRGLRLIMDYVPNHSSDRHPWFLESRAARDSARRDWYIWRDPAPDGGPPTNWLSEFGGPAWTYDERTGQYWLHTYLREQPDLNWRNPAVERAMHDVLRFWLDRGVDGFRLDALSHLLKDDRFRDNPPNPAHTPDESPYRALLPIHTNDLPEIHDVLRRLRAVADAYADRLLVGELYLPLEALVRYYGAAGDEIHLPTNFQLIKLPWEAPVIARAIEAYEAALPDGGWPNWVLGNHDKPRVASRVGRAQARVAAMLLLTVRGTPTIYYGDEIGLRDVPVGPGQVQDPWEKNVPGRGLGRDPQRSPLPWDDGPGAGFTTGTPWLPLAPDRATVNVAAQRRDPRSMLALYRALIALRRAHPALAVGRIDVHPASEPDVLLFGRDDGTSRILVALNFSSAAVSVTVDGTGVIALSTHLDRDGERVTGTVALRADEGVVIRTT